MLQVGERTADARLVIADKDGTLIAFQALWHAWMEAMWAELEARVPLDERARRGLAESLGMDLATREWDPLGALTLAATSEVATIIASQLYRYARLTWPESVDVVDDASRAAYRSLPLDELLEPVGDVVGWLGRLRAAGVRVALATADDRAPTEDTLRRLGWLSCFDLVLCGDDGLPQKPAPDMALEACRRLGVPPSEAIMIGDTIADLQMARRAGLAMAVGVTSGALTAELLAPHADAVVRDVHEVQPVGDGGRRP